MSRCDVDVEVDGQMVDGGTYKTRIETSSIMHCDQDSFYLTLSIKALDGADGDVIFERSHSASVARNFM